MASFSVSASVPGVSRPGSSPDRGHCVVFLGKTLYSHSASLHPGVKMGTGEFLRNLTNFGRVTSGRSRNDPNRFMCLKPG